jgi:hypothetical protein
MTVFYCYNKITKTGYFIKKRGLFTSQFWHAFLWHCHPGKGLCECVTTWQRNRKRTGNTQKRLNTLGGLAL